MEFIDKSQIMQGIESDSTADILEKGINHKYFKREGTPGNYKYYYTEEEYKKAKNPHDSRFKFQKDTKVSFVKNGETINGIISDYDYNSVTFDKEYNVDYEKDGKTWTMIGVPEGKIQELQEDKKNLAKEIVERQKSLPKEDIGKKLENVSEQIDKERSERKEKMDEYEKMAKEMESLDGWSPSSISNTVYKDYNNSFVTKGQIDIQFDMFNNEIYFKVNVAYGKFESQKMQNQFLSNLYELRDKKFLTINEAVDALDSFVLDWDKEPRTELLKLESELKSLNNKKDEGYTNEERERMYKVMKRIVVLKGRGF